MDFSLGADRQLLTDTLRRFLAERYPIDRRHHISASAEGYSREVWAELAELGIPAALVDEASGGFGGSGFDVLAVFETLGRSLVVEPFLGLLMASRLLAGRSERLSAIVAGTELCTVALHERQGRYDLTNVLTRAERRGEGFSVSGSKAVVPQIGSATLLLVSAKTAAGLSLFAIPRDAKGVKIDTYPLIDGGRGGDVHLDGVQLPADALVGEDGHALAALEAAVAAGIVALCAEAVGIMDVMRAATLDYLRTRVQFGVAIGKFQTLQHRMANVATEIEQARSAAINAAAALDGPRDARERAISAAKLTIGRVGTLVAEESIQMHGGIGMTWELPLPHYAKRLTMIGHQLGDEDYHLERYIQLSRTES